uniref:Convicilin n=1 Tax=Vicia narbonensis TaxID=3912 RepID=Q41674_VICNA|nr:convicilin precursor [Vicia narbonensis]
MATAMKSRFPVLLLLGIIILASLCVTYANYDEGTEPRVPGQRERGRQEGEKEEKRHGEWRPSHEKEAQPGRRERWETSEEEERVDEEWRGSQRHEDPEERARERYRAEERERRRQWEGEEKEGSSKSQERRNPFLFKSNKFLTLFENENGHIRRLQRFDKRSDLFENLQNYRLVEYRAKPHTIFLPQHIDADLILTVLSGRAILTVLSPNDRNSYNLERGDTIKLPAGTTSYLLNQDDEEDLRVVDLSISVNRPGKVESFGLSGSKNQYLRGFSKNILEASLNTKYETIEKVLLEEPQQSIGQKRRSQRQETNALVKVSREQVEELKRLAKSSSKKGVSSEFEPFNLRSQNPKYSNKFGKLFEITPEKKYPQLQDLDIFVSSVEINEGGLMLPHYNSRAIVILLVNEGKGNLELVGLKNEQQEQREREDEQQVQRYEARLSPGDVVIIPAGHPVAVSASSNLNLLGFGINAENNQRNFLTGSDDNVISQIENPVKELTFPGSAQEVNRLLKNQEHSHFANAEPEQKGEESQRKRSPISSILGTFN